MTNGSLDGITIRRATADDPLPTYGVFLDAAEDLARTRGWAPTPRRPDPPERFLAFRASALRHDPDGFWVAEADGGLVGFGIAVQREHVWYLAALHVRPATSHAASGPPSSGRRSRPPARAAP